MPVSRISFRMPLSEDACFLWRKAGGYEGKRMVAVLCGNSK